MKTLPACLFVAATCISANVFAFNTAFLKEVPAARFNKEDWALLREAAKKALTNSQDGETVTWQNPKTGSSGSISLLESFKQNDLNCRSIEVKAKHKSLSNQQVLPVCKASDGIWKVVAP